MNTREFVSPAMYGNLKNPGTKTWEKLSHVKTTVTTRRDATPTIPDMALDTAVTSLAAKLAHLQWVQ